MSIQIRPLSYCYCVETLTKIISSMFKKIQLGALYHPAKRQNTNFQVAAGRLILNHKTTTTKYRQRPEISMLKVEIPRRVVERSEF
ncbi:hypothetical protein WA026_017507 [Henosepilachna vigintioctopunctata]|uniref:Uncharacterized protein n=1 Tax=Henosepilachna vigintioctopunctata TaxID=420089 RepID=A0AAW1V1D3_9CUCU